MKRTLLVGSIFIVSMSAVAVRARAQGEGAFAQRDFSATEIVTSPGGKAMSMKVYRSGDKLRTDMAGGKMHTVLLMQEKKYYMVTPQMCMQMPQMANQNPQPFGATGNVVRKDMGSATVDAHPAKIQDITMTPPNGGNPVTMKAWEATDLKGFPVRIEMATAQGTVTTEFKDINLSSPPDSLFAVPQDCRTMPTMPGMPHPGQ